MGGSVSIKPFDFRNDFSAPSEDQTDQVSLAPADLASLLAQARAEGLIEGKSAAHSEKAKQQSNSVDHFRDALTELVKLAEYLEATAGAEGAPVEVRALIKAAAQRLVDGQGDLFNQNSSAEIS